MFFSVPGFFRAPHSFSKILVCCKKWAANYSKYRQNISFGTITLFWPQAVVDQPRHLFEKDEFCKDPIHHMLERTTMKQIVANSQDWRLALCRFSCLVRQTCMQPTVKFLNEKDICTEGGNLAIFRNEKIVVAWLASITEILTFIFTSQKYAVHMILSNKFSTGSSSPCVW